MEQKVLESRRVGDRYYVIDHPTGLKIFVYPKENSNSTFAIFGTNYGSVDTCFKRSDETETTTVPEGIAHFLEHKLFENEDCDAFARYAKTGASANAYTSFDMTGYLFSCTENVYESLEILLDFVQDPYFTEQTVQKEQGIIGQEIRMYDDDPGWRVMFNLLGALYHTHPVKIDIAGTVESIAEITPELLYRCYNTFYNLNNMVLVVAGKVDVEQVRTLADRMLKQNPPVTVEKYFQPEPREVVTDYVEQKLSVAVPLFQLGFKEEVTAERKTTKELAQTEILLDILAADWSPMFRRLMDEELINESSFSYEYFEGPGYASVLFAGESHDPKRAAEIIREEIRKLKETGIDPKDFARAQKAIYGRNVSALNSAQNIGNAMMSLYFAGRELFEYLDVLAEMRVEDLNACLKTQLDDRYAALSVIYPIEEKGAVQ